MAARPLGAHRKREDTKKWDISLFKKNFPIFLVTFIESATRCPSPTSPAAPPLLSVLKFAGKKRQGIKPAPLMKLIN